MSIIIMIIVGFIVGLIARAVMPGDQPMGIVMTTILGIVGSVVAGFLGRQLGWYHDGEPAGWIASVVGAIIVLFVVGLIARNAPDAAPRPASSGAQENGPASRVGPLLAAQPPAGPRISRRRLAPVAPRPPPRRALGPAAAQRLVQVHQVGQARAARVHDCWALYSERCESSTLR